jgi:DnaJ-domain-containing protein 1
MELEAELHAIERRLADPSTELGRIHARLKEMGARLASLKSAAPADSPPAGEKPTYYELLKLKPGASAEEIRNAYHRLLKQYHPDLHNSSEYAWVKAESERMSKKISEAYQVLIDSERRARYDRELRNPRRPGA